MKFSVSTAFFGLLFRSRSTDRKPASLLHPERHRPSYRSTAHFWHHRHLRRPSSGFSWRSVFHSGVGDGGEGKAGESSFWGWSRAIENQSGEGQRKRRWMASIIVSVGGIAERGRRLATWKKGRWNFERDAVMLANPASDIALRMLSSSFDPRRSLCQDDVLYIVCFLLPFSPPPDLEVCFLPVPLIVSHFPPLIRSGGAPSSSAVADGMNRRRARDIH